VISGIHAYHKRDITSMRNNKCIAVERFAAVRRKGEAREVKDCSPVMRRIGDAGTVINKRGEVHPRNESANGHFTTTTIRPDALGAVAGQRPGCGGIFGLSKVAFLGNYIPRRCGLATFTADLRGAVIERYPDLECPVVAVNDRPFPYDYPSEVCLEIFEPNLGSYRLASTFLNLANVDVLCVQHEFGIFGGVEGSHVLTLLKAVKMPVVTTLHTVLQDPSSEQRRILEEVVRLSDRVVVMSRKAAHFVRDIYDVAEERIDIIPHGIPDFRFVDPDSYKEQCGLARKRTVFTFGLLSPNKGIENVINALPQVIAKFPDVIYVIAGTTHPNLVRDRGEEYRLSLEQLVRKRGVENHVMISTSLRISNGSRLPVGRFPMGLGQARLSFLPRTGMHRNSSQKIRELLFLLTIQTPSLAQSTNFCRTKSGVARWPEMRIAWDARWYGPMLLASIGGVLNTH
jgi:glycosyl transferase family 4/glycosyl transferase family 1